MIGMIWSRECLDANLIQDSRWSLKAYYGLLGRLEHSESWRRGREIILLYDDGFTRHGSSNQPTYDDDKVPRYLP